MLEEEELYALCLVLIECYRNASVFKGLVVVLKQLTNCNKEEVSSKLCYALLLTTCNVIEFSLLLLMHNK